MRIRGWEVGAAALLAIGVRVRPSLGFRWSETVVDGLLMAGWIALLAAAIFSRWPAIRRALGRRIEPRPSWLFFLLPFAFYLILLPWTTSRRAPDGDEPYYLLVAHSIAWDFDTDLRDEYADGDSLRYVGRRLEPQPGDPVGRDGELHSRHNATLPALLAPALRLGGLHGALAVMAALAALLAWAFVRAAGHDYADRPGPVAAAWAMLAFAPPLAIYAHQVWAEVPAALLMLLAWDASRRLEASPRPTGREWAAFLVPVLLLPLLKFRFIGLAAPLLLLTAARSSERARRLLLWGGVGLAALLGFVIAFNMLAYGHPLKYDVLHAKTYFKGPVSYLKGLLGLFFDGAYGLIPTAPIWIVALVGAGIAARRRSRLLVDALILFGPYLLAVAPRGEWYGGWSPVFRYGLVTLPFLALLGVEAFDRRKARGARIVLTAVVVLTAALTVLWIVRPGWTYHLADGSTRIVDALSNRFEIDAGRFVPSMVRTRPATWIVPVLLLLGVPWLWRTEFGARRPARSTALWSGAGFVAALLAIPAWIVAADRLPTRVLHWEDAQVEHRGGSVHPPPWTPGRARFRGAWVLREGEELHAPIVRGGRRVRIRLDWQPTCPGGVLTLRSAGRRFIDPEALATRTAPDASEGWRSVRFGPLDWPRGEEGSRIGFRVEPRPIAEGDCFFLLDRAVFDWDPIEVR